jgi:hypothetical protein
MKYFLLLIFVVQLSFSFGQSLPEDSVSVNELLNSMQLLALPPPGGDDDPICDDVTLIIENQSCTGARLRAYGPAGCSFQFRLYRIGSGFVAQDDGEVVYFNISANGTYYVEGWNSNGIFTSSNVTIGQIEITIAKPYFSGSSNRDLCPESTTSIATTASQSGVTYKLYRGTSTLLKTMSGTGSGLTFGNYDVAGSYKVVASNNNICKANSVDSDLLTITKQTLTATLTASNANPCPSDPVTLTGRTYHNGTEIEGINFHWYKDGVLDASSKTNTHSILESGAWTVKIFTGACGTYDPTSDPANITYQTNENVSLNLTVTPNGSICGGDLMTITAVPTNGGSNPSYYWEVNDFEHHHQGTSEITLNTVDAYTSPITVSCIVTSNATGCFGERTATSSVTRTVYHPVPKPVFSSPSVSSVEICPGATQSFGISNSVDFATYSLIRNDTEVIETKTGTGSGVLTFASQSQEGTYKVVASDPDNQCGVTEISSSNVALSHYSISTTIDASPKNPCPGQSVELTATSYINGVETLGGINYEWYKDGARGSSSKDNRTSISEGGTWTVAVRGLCAGYISVSDNSVNVTYQSNQNVYLDLDVNPRGSICEGDQMTITANPTNGGSSPSYYWEVNDVEHHHQGTKQITLNALEAYSSPITVSCTMTSNATGCIGERTATSSVTRTVYQPIPKPVFSSPSASSVELCPGETQPFIISNSVDFATYSLIRNDTEVIETKTGTGSGVLTFASQSQEGTYKVVASDPDNQCGSN